MKEQNSNYYMVLGEHATNMSLNKDKALRSIRIGIICVVGVLIMNAVLISPSAAISGSDYVSDSNEYIEITVSVSNGGETSEEIPVRIATNTSNSIPEEQYSEILSSEQYNSIDDDGDGEITLEELVQTNIERVQNDGETVEGVSITLNELVQSNINRVNA